MITSEKFKVNAGGSSTTAVFESPPSPRSNLVLVLAHGAGSDMEHESMKRLSAEFLERGLGCVRFNFLYREEGKKTPDRMPRLMECMTEVAAEVRKRFLPERLVIGGRSMGGRAASMLMAEGFASDGLILLAYPLHPPGKTENLRDAHLSKITAPVLAVSGTRDSLCRQDLMLGVLEKLPPFWTMHWLEGADHGFHVTKASGRTDQDVLKEIGAVSIGWVHRSFSSDTLGRPADETR